MGKVQPWTFDVVIEQLKSGPPQSEMEKLKVEAVDALDIFDYFEIEIGTHI